MSLKKVFLAGVAVLLASAGIISADYNDFVSSLNAVHIDSGALATAPTVSRDELAQLLNLVDCHDCHRPGQDMVQRLTSSRWDTFRLSPTANFDDITYNSSADTGNNYYCVAYTAEQGYMAGYPRQTSPLCSGKFCGGNNTTVADFLQVMINILADRIASHYQVNWKTVEQWIQNPAQSTLTKRYFSLPEQAIIHRDAATCTAGACSLTSADEFSVYLKYCTFNLSVCGMQERNTAKQDFRPVAELNVLVLEGVLTDSDANTINVNDYVDGKTVLNSLSKVKEKVACTFTNDQDHDGIPDYLDNCYLTYNPSQKDTNHNGIGDVCDSDIDGDGIKNPVGIVDDNGNINTKALVGYTGQLDNCLFVPNVDQKDANNDGVGNACSENQSFGLSIIAKKVKNGSYIFAANITGNMSNFAWDFGDGSYGQGKIVSHTFPGPGIYTVVLTALGGTRTYIATTTIVVAIDITPALGFQIFPRPLTAYAPATIAVTPVTTRPVGRIEWQTNGQHKTGNDGQTISFLYENAGTYPIIAQAYDNTQIVAYAQASVSLDGSIGSYLQASNLTPKQGEQIRFSTTTAGIQKKDIASIKWDFGDGTIITNSALIQDYTYSLSGPKIVTQTIYLLDGTILTNIIDINVLPSQNADDQSVDLVPDKLVLTTAEQNHYTFDLNGILRTDVARIIVDMGNGQTLTFPGSLSQGFNYQYINPGIYRIMARVQKTDGLWFYPAAQVTVTGLPFCLQKPPLSGNACDMNHNGIPDICDTDIDGDGIPNLLGLIVTQPANCQYTSGDLNQTIIDKTITLIATGANLDNCSLTSNANQKDANANFIGDVCEGLITVQTGSLDDGIVPTTIPVSDPTPDPGVKTMQCNICPCPYVQDAADLKRGDKVKALLLTSGSTQPVSTSSEHIVE